MNTQLRRSIATVVALLPLVIVLSTIPAYADVCVPMVTLVWPESWRFLIFIIPIEIAIGLRVLPSNRTTTVKAVVIANIVSTLVGIPLTLVVFYFLGAAIMHLWGVATPVFGQWEKLTLIQKTIVIATQGGPLQLPTDVWSWTSLASAMVLCIPFFFLSVWLEYLVGRAFFSKGQRGLVLRWSWIANVCSYTFVLIVLGVRLLWMLISG